MCKVNEPRDFPTFSKQGPGTNDFGKNNMYISQIGKMDTKQNRGYNMHFGVNLRRFLKKKNILRVWSTYPQQINKDLFIILGFLT